MSTIYEQLGTDAIRTAVDRFYQHVVGDPELADYFDGVDMSRLRRHQAALLVQVTGGPAEYDGRDLAEAHAPLGITEEHFGRVVGHLVTTLRELEVPASIIDQIVATLATHKDAIVTAPGPRVAETTRS